MSADHMMDRRAGPRRAPVSLLRAEEIAEPLPTRARLASLLGIANGEPPAPELPGEPMASPRVRVILTGAAYQALDGSNFSRQVEQGGFLLGRHYADADAPGRDLLVLTEVAPAEGTGTRHSFRFLGESFLGVADTIARREPGTGLLGWYHTHVVPVVGDGLSQVDVDLHRWTFRQAWQVAALLETGFRPDRLRVFYLDEDTPRETAAWILAPAARVGRAAS